MAGSLSLAVLILQATLTGRRVVLRKSVRVEVVSPEMAAGVPADARVIKASKFLLAVEVRRRAIELLDRGDVEGARTWSFAASECAA